MQRLNPILLPIVTMFYWFSVYTYVPIFPPYLNQMGLSLSAVGLVLGSYGLTQMIVRIPIGIAADRTGRRKPYVIAGLLVGTLSSAGFALFPAPALALLWRSLAGVAAGAWVAYTVMFARFFSSDEAPRAMSLLSYYASLGQMIAMLLGGILAGQFGIHFVFVIAACGGVIGLFIALWLQETPKRATEKPPSLLRMAADPRTLRASLLAALAQAVTFTTLFGFTPIKAAHLHATHAQLGELTVLSTLPNALAGYLSSRPFMQRFGPRKLVTFGFLLSAVATLAIPYSTSMIWLFITQAFNGLGQGICMPQLMGLSIRHVREDLRATAMGFFQAVYSIGMFGGPVLVGLISRTSGLRGGFVAISLISLLGALASFITLRIYETKPYPRTSS